MSPLAHVVEWIIVITLVLGLATAYGALLALAFVVIAFVTAHLYWEFPQAVAPAPTPRSRFNSPVLIGISSKDRCVG
ncbi:MAG TPA: hypothetical protein VHY10_13340 [Xanthobacteraceae bacterium]|jgi:uncharacterized membrane protein YphA (DoxX/SURF4 family)|nr:hypothetical protein [Xanthobacteraceae bacterium]